MLPKTCLKDVAHDHFVYVYRPQSLIPVHVLGLDLALLHILRNGGPDLLGVLGGHRPHASPPQCLLDHRPAQIHRRHILQDSSEGTDGRSDCTHNHWLSGVHCCYPSFSAAMIRSNRMPSPACLPPPAMGHDEPVNMPVLRKTRIRPSPHRNQGAYADRHSQRDPPHSETQSATSPA